MFPCLTLSLEALHTSLKKDLNTISSEENSVTPRVPFFKKKKPHLFYLSE